MTWNSLNEFMSGNGDVAVLLRAQVYSLKKDNAAYQLSVKFLGEQNDKLREENLILRERCRMLQGQIDNLVDEVSDLDEAMR